MRGRAPAHGTEHDIGVEARLDRRQRRQPARRGLFVVVEEGDHRGRRGHQPGVAGAGDSRLRLVDIDQREGRFGLQLARDVRGAGLRVVVDHDEFKGGVGNVQLAEHRTDRAGQPVRPPPRRYDDGNLRRGRGHACSGTGAARSGSRLALRRP